MSRRTLFIAYYFAVFIQAGTYGLTFLLPPLFEGIGGDEIDVGKVLGITAITTIFSVFALGHITTIIGRMYTIAVSSGLISLALCMFAYADHLGLQLYIAGGLLGVGWGLYYVLTPVVLTQLVTKEDRVRAFTLLSVFIMAGFGLTPALGGALTKAGLGIDATFLIIGLCCLLSGGIFSAIKNAVARHSISAESNLNAALSPAITFRIFISKAVRPIAMVWLGASVFAAVTNFQTVYAGNNGLDYAVYFFAYTMTVIICRVILAEFIGGRSPYGVIAGLQAVMTMSILLLIYLGDSHILYILAAILFGIGYGVSYPIVKAMAANDAQPEILSQTLQIFGVAYFIGVFGFPFVAGWIITTYGMTILLVIAVVMSALECLLAFRRHKIDNRSTN